MPVLPHAHTRTLLPCLCYHTHARTHAHARTLPCLCYHTHTHARSPCLCYHTHTHARCTMPVLPHAHTRTLPCVERNPRIPQTRADFSRHAVIPVIPFTHQQGADAGRGSPSIRAPGDQGVGRCGAIESALHIAPHQSKRRNAQLGEGMATPQTFIYR